MPAPVERVPKKWRRVMSRALSEIISFLRYRFIQIQDQAGDAGIGRQFGGIETRRFGRIAVLENSSAALESAR